MNLTNAVTSLLREVDELMDQPIPSTSLGEYYDSIGDLLTALEQVPASNPNETTTDEVKQKNFNRNLLNLEINIFYLKNNHKRITGKHS